MNKIAVVTKVDNENYNCFEKNVQTIINIIPESEIYCITGDTIDKNSLNYENRVIFINSISNELFNDINSGYILFMDSNKELDVNVLNKLIKILQSNPDVLIFNKNCDYLENMNILSRISGNRMVSHENIKDYLFGIDESIFSKIYKKEFLQNNFDMINIEHSELLNIKTLIEAEKILFVNELLYKEKTEYFNNIGLDYFEKYVKAQNDILKYLKSSIYYLKSKDNYIQKLLNKFNQITFEDKKASYIILRNSFIELLDDKNITDILDNISKVNRKNFEQVIISESLEEYLLLKNVYEDKQSIEYMKRYSKILESEEKKIKNFNKSLTSSNSWKLTKVFRLIRIKWFSW